MRCRVQPNSIGREYVDDTILCECYSNIKRGFFNETDFDLSFKSEGGVHYADEHLSRPTK